MQLILHYDETYREVKYGNMGLPDIDSKMLMGINVTPIAALLYTPVLIRCQAAVPPPRLCGLPSCFEGRGPTAERPCLFGSVRRKRGNPNYRGGTKSFPPPHNTHAHLHIWFRGGSRLVASYQTVTSWPTALKSPAQPSERDCVERQCSQKGS